MLEDIYINAEDSIYYEYEFNYGYLIADIL